MNAHKFDGLPEIGRMVAMQYDGSKRTYRGMVIMAKCPGEVSPKGDTVRNAFFQVAFGANSLNPEHLQGKAGRTGNVSHPDNAKMVRECRWEYID